MRCDAAGRAEESKPALGQKVKKESPVRAGKTIN